MNKITTQLLLDALQSAAAEFSNEEEELDFSIKVLINCQNGWVYVKQV